MDETEAKSEPEPDVKSIECDDVCELSISFPLDRVISIRCILFPSRRREKCV